MKQILLGVSAFFITALICAFISWCGGFNFDARNGEVACGVAVSMLFSLFTGILFGKLIWLD